MENNNFAFGHSWSSIGSAFVSYDMQIGREHAEYNLSDYSGDHKRNSKHYKKQDETTRTIIDGMISAARADMRANLAYKQARRKDTTFEHLQYCWMVSIGYGGVTWYIDEDPDGYGHIEGYDLSESEKEEVMRLGIPFIDITTIPHDDCIAPSLSGPMPPNKPDRGESAPYNSLSYAPLNVYANFWRMLGADVRNVETIDLDPALFSNPKIQALLMKG